MKGNKSTSLHHTSNGMCVFLSFDSGKRWKLSATPIPIGYGENPCPQVSNGDSRTIYEGALESAIADAKKLRKKTMTLYVNGHNVELIVKNVEAKMAHVREMEEFYQHRKKRR